VVFNAHTDRGRRLAGQRQQGLGGIKLPRFILMDCVVFVSGGQWLQNVGEVNHSETVM